MKLPKFLVNSKNSKENTLLLRTISTRDHMQVVHNNKALMSKKEYNNKENKIMSATRDNSLNKH